MSMFNLKKEVVALRGEVRELTAVMREGFGIEPPPAGEPAAEPPPAEPAGEPAAEASEPEAAEAPAPAEAATDVEA